ncbi:MAG TPA: hypothetical protein VFE47_29245 [Tepidisphaeraceae bacterium]|jgi:hypothetical protein|nr:hypothetical protein [Tepidisphaeraceae bacterium]
MTESSSILPARYDRWKAPAEDGQILIWPPPDELLRNAQENQRHLNSAASVLVQGVSLPQVRTALRTWLGHANDEQPLIATGHQAELHHPGVWVKNALINSVATRMNGRAIHFAVDTDEPKHLHLRWPGGSVALSDVEQPRAEWSGLVPAPTPAHLNDVQASFDAAARAWNFKPMVDSFLGILRQAAPAAPNLPAALTHAVQSLDSTLGLHHDAPLVSPMCESEPYLLFVHHLLARADIFAADYNTALEEFRTENKIRTPGRPMPNLKCTPDGCEVPFWLDDISAGTRTRAAVAREGGAFILRLSTGDQFRLDPNADGWPAASALRDFLKKNRSHLSPRALTLTAVLRLLVADQFVHGIGGGQYDQVLDKLITRHFKLAAPRFAVTTATLFFPGAIGQSRICQPCVAQEGHRLRHALLGEEKRELVSAIASAPRRSAERSLMFSKMHTRLAAARSGQLFRDWEARYQETMEREKQEKVLFDRELFYAVQPRERLEGMIAKYQEAFASGEVVA